MEDFISNDDFNMELRELDEALINIECDDILSRADANGMLLEVVWSAFKHKEQFKNASFLECLQVGLNEWDL
jgi:hypothetical protein